MRELVRQEEQHHVALTRAVANFVWPQFSPFVQGAARLDDEALRSHTETLKLHRAVVRDLAGTRVLKIKIYDIHGRTVFSTEPSQIGEDKSANAGFAAARGGTPASELTHRNQFSAFEQMVENVDVLSSYIPIYGPDSGRIEAVFEIYSDLSALLGRIHETRRTVVLWVSAVLLALYGVLFFIVRHADTVIRRQAAQIDRSEEFHRSLIEHSFDAVLVLASDLKIRQATASVAPILGRTPASVLGRTLTDCLPAHERGRAASWLAEVLSSPRRSRIIELVPGAESGGAAYLEAVATNELAHPAIGGIVVNMRDISTRKRAEMEVRRLALYDSLTGLANRDLFMQQLRTEAANAGRRADLSAVLFIDLDGFKDVNDTLGHGVGDDLLREAAARIRRAVRAGDLIGRDHSSLAAENIARMGGDEFTVLLPRLRRPEDAALVTGRLLELIAEPYEVGGERVLVTASIGVALCPPDGRSAEDLLRNADLAMYHAKKQGKNTFRFFSAELHPSSGA